MAGKKKRTNKPIYAERVAPYLDEIGTMAAAGVPQERIREMLGVSKSAWYRFKAAYPELAGTLSFPKGRGVSQDAPDDEVRTQKVQNLETAMERIALGYDRQIIRYFSTRDGIETVPDVEHHPPNFQALRFLLMNWGGYMSEPAAQAQREKEFAHKKAMDEKTHW